MKNILLFFSAITLSAQMVDLSPRKAATYTTLPATCTVGETAFKTDATAGQNFYGCTATNTWTQQANGKPIIAVEMVVVDFGTATSTGDGKYYLVIPSTLNGMNLVSVSGSVISVGTTNTTDIQLARCATVATGSQCSGTVADMLSTKLTIDSNENKSSTAATPPVINGANDDVATDQVIRVDVDAISTTPATGLIVVLGFQLP